MKYHLERGRVVALPMAAVTDCSGCGACCRTIGTPPGYAVFYPKPPHELAEWAAGSEDHERWLRLKAEAPAVEEELGAYYRAALHEGTIPDRQEYGEPCLWLDETTMRCRHYEHRPTVCRTALQPGDSACLDWRRQFGIPSPPPRTP